MVRQDKTIRCPQCDNEIDVTDILYHQIEQEVSDKYSAERAEQKSSYQQELRKLNHDKKLLEEQKYQQKQKQKVEVEKAIKLQGAEIEHRIKSKLAEENKELIAGLSNELEDKTTQLKQFNKARAALERVKREKDELQSKIEAETQLELNKKLTEERIKIQRNEAEKNQLKLSERETVITQLNNQLKEAQRQAEQGSMQIQGEVQELAIEEWLADQFPLDSIVEIKKGVRGADCIHIVNTRARNNCGSICYESKRTKKFEPAWIDKFKNDIREKGADIGVLVTQSMPGDMDRMGLKNGVWICSFEEFKGLSLVLRELIIKLSTVISTQENKGDKMSMLYDYVTGNEFRLQVEAIVDSYSQMQRDLESEKRSMTGIWKKREKQIEKVLLNTTYMYGSMKGIAGNAIESVAALELDNQIDEDE